MKKSLILLFFVCAGIVVGSLVAKLAEQASWLSWLNFGMNFGITSPLVLDLGVLTLTFGAAFNLNVSIIIFVLISVGVGILVTRRR